MTACMCVPLTFWLGAHPQICFCRSLRHFNCEISFRVYAPSCAPSNEHKRWFVPPFFPCPSQPPLVGAHSQPTSNQLSQRAPTSHPLKLKSKCEPLIHSHHTRHRTHTLDPSMVLPCSLLPHSHRLPLIILLLHLSGIFLSPKKNN